MKKWPALAVAVTALTATLPTLASAATLPDPAPTNVQISWATDGSRRVHVTWDEAAPVSNKVFARDLDSSAVVAAFYPPADAGNTINFDASNLATVSHDRRLEMVVVAGTPAGVTSPEGRSVAFDNHVPDTVLDSVTQTATGMTVKVHPVPYNDTTPNDPLDAAQLTYEPKYSMNYRQYSLGAPGEATEFSITHPAPGYRFYVKTDGHWISEVWGDYVNVDHANLTVQGPPARLEYNAATVFRGSLGPLVERQQQLVVLQARNSPTSPWYAVTTMMAPTETGNYSFSVLARSREYRIAVPGHSRTEGNGFDEWTLLYGGYSALMKSVAYQRVYGKFTTPKIRVGQTASAQAMLSVSVPTSVVALQRWNGKTWVFVQNITLKNNVGYAKVTSKTAGVATYRMYSPNLTKDGMLVAAAYSPNFTLTTVR
jgi:hypothetical protein